MDTQFSNLELQRYARHFVLPEVGMEGQALLKNAKVLCIGAGGLGSPVLMYLAAAGIGTLGIVENDRIELSNLQRQILYHTDDVNEDKGEVAKKRLLALNPHVEINLHSDRLQKSNALDILATYDLVIDGTDNFYSRYLINDACFYLNKPTIYAGIFRFEGQCSVFYASKGPCYRCLFRTLPVPELIPNCVEAGVIGALPGLLGTIQAIEAIKLILNKGSSLIGRLLLIDILAMQFRELTLQQNPDCPLCVHKIPFEELELPELNCDVSSPNALNELSVYQFQALRKEKPNHFFLLDVREKYEYEISNLDGYLIPLKDLSHRVNELDPSQHIIIHCKSDSRSRIAAEFLKKCKFSKVSILKGGILAYNLALKENTQGR